MKFTTFITKSSVIAGRVKNIHGHVKQLATLHAAETLADASITKLHLYYASVQTNANDFDGLVDKISQTTAADFDLQKVLEIQDEFLEAVLDVKTDIKAILPNIDAIDMELNASNESHETPITMPRQSVKLPKINLPHFSGNLTEWTSFYHLFETTIHLNNSLSPVEKFSYLLSCLHGEAFNLLKGLPLSSINYNIAWQNLQQRYQNPRRLINLHISKLIDLPAVSISSVKGLRQFIDTFNENSQALRALNYDVSQELTLFTILFRKLDNELSKRFEDKRDIKELMPTVTSLITFLMDECMKFENAAQNATSKPLPAKPHLVLKSNTSPKPDYKHKHTFHANTMFTSSCAYCKTQSHSIYQCKDFQGLSVNERFKFVKSKGYCVNCLGTGHTLNNCNSQRKCQTCGLEHHTLLHFSQNPRSPQVKST